MYGTLYDHRPMFHVISSTTSRGVCITLSLGVPLAYLYKWDSCVSFELKVFENGYPVSDSYEINANKPELSAENFIKYRSYMDVGYENIVLKNLRNSLHVFNRLSTTSTHR